VLNAVMLYHLRAGGPRPRDSLIQRKLHRYPSIPERRAQTRRRFDLVARRRSHCCIRRTFSGERKSTVTAEDRKSMPLDDRLARYNTSKVQRDGLIDDLNEAMTTARAPPSKIINGPVDEGHGTRFGRLVSTRKPDDRSPRFCNSAEAMKAGRRRISNRTCRNRKARPRARLFPRDP